MKYYTILSGTGKKEDITFTKEGILDMLWAGDTLYEVIPKGEIIGTNSKNTDKKWRANNTELVYIGSVLDNIPFLVEQGADIHVDDDYPVYHFATHGHLDIMKYLIGEGARLNVLNKYSVRVICENGYLDIIKFLCKNWDRMKSYLDYSLRIAARYGHTDIVKYLVEQGADIHTNDDAPMKIAQKNGHLDVVNYLKWVRDMGICGMEKNPILVKDLIEQLKTLPQDQEILIYPKYDTVDGYQKHRFRLENVQEMETSNKYKYCAILF